MSERALHFRAIVVAFLLAGIGRTWPADGLEPTWLGRHLNPQGDAIALALEVEDAATDSLWLLAQRYRGARGEGEAYHELWLLEGSERRSVHTISAEQVEEYSDFAALRRLQDGRVATGFLTVDGRPIILVLDPGGTAPRAWTGNAALAELAPATALAIHADGGVTVSAGEGLSTVTRFGPDGEALWSHAFTGEPGTLVQVTELTLLGDEVVAIGIGSPAEEEAASSGRMTAGLLILGPEGQAGTITTLEAPTAQRLSAPAGEVAVALGRFGAGVDAAVAAFRRAQITGADGEGSGESTSDESTAGEAALRLESRPGSKVLPTAAGRNRRLAVTRVCGEHFLFADDEAPSGHDGKHIRLVLVGPDGATRDTVLTGPSPEDVWILSGIVFAPHGEELSLAATVVKVLENRQIRSGIDLYRVDLGDVCGR